MLDQNSEPARSILRAIEDHGPISFAEFTELALYGPGGFYERPPVGERGHFVTAPHVHPVFGELIGRAIRACWQELGRPDPLSIVEVGAGDGTLAVQVRRALADVPKRYVAVERSAGARDALCGLDPPVRVVASLESIDQHVDGVVLANELLDNLPFRWARRDDRGVLLEVFVEFRDGRFVPIEQPFPEGDEEALSALPHPLPPDADAPVPVGALQLVDRLARVLHRGYAVLIDYAAGPLAEIHGYRSQRVVDDVLDQPGTADITAGVDFRVLAERARGLGLQSFTPVTQQSALLALGYDRWAQGERRRQVEAQDRRAGREAALAWSGRNAAAQLVDPDGLGRLRWWVVATRDLPEPDWLVAASRRELEAVATAPEGTMTFTDVRRGWWRPSRRWRMRAAIRRASRG